MFEFLEWFTQPLSLGEQMVQWAGVAGAAGLTAAIVRMAVRAQREDAMAAEHGAEVVTVVEFPKAEKAGDRVELDLTDLIRWGGAAGAGAGEPDRGDLDEESDELAPVLPLLPRDERAALRAGGGA
ncbi:MAG: hypothetical protein ACRDTJ_22465 [Pseudonocardiaceae bacterium]